jgi:hypothetical protein
MLGIEFWEKEWAVITGAPAIVAAGLAALIAVDILIVRWAFVIIRWGFSREIGGLKATITALNERLQLAHDVQAAFSRKFENLETQVEQLTQQINQKAPANDIANATALVTGTIGDLALANSVLGRTLSLGAGIGADSKPVKIEPKKSDG